jgi:hypothetical protein
MFVSQQKVVTHIKGQNIQLKEMQHLSEPDTDMAGCYNDKTTNLE